MKLSSFIKLKNKRKKLFTPGPSSLSEENILELNPCFGRGDIQYETIEAKVLDKLKKISGHKFIARLQGSASLALEISIHNFLFGNVLIVHTGVYSQRLIDMIKNSKKINRDIRAIKIINWNNLYNINGKYDWIISCVTETSIGLKIPIRDLYKIKKNCKSKLMLDATASIGLEDEHELADLIAYSSCKGLFGLTGASFIAYNKNPQNEIKSFYMSIYNHINKKMTGPYHTIQSLHKILQKYDQFKYAVKINKEKFLKDFKDLIIFPKINQPLLCTYSKKKLFSKDKKIIFYKTRSKLKGSVLCHLGEVHLKRKAKANILKNILFK